MARWLMGCARVCAYHVHTCSCPAEQQHAAVAAELLKIGSCYLQALRVQLQDAAETRTSLPLLVAHRWQNPLWRSRVRQQKRSACASNCTIAQHGSLVCVDQPSQVSHLSNHLGSSYDSLPTGVLRRSTLALATSWHQSVAHPVLSYSCTILYQ